MTKETKKKHEHNNKSNNNMQGWKTIRQDPSPISKGDPKVSLFIR
jgi:hypothetical protein